MTNEQEVNKIEKVDLLELQINLLDCFSSLVTGLCSRQETNDSTDNVDYNTSQ